MHTSTIVIMSSESDILREIDFTAINPLSVTFLLQNRERCLVFDSRLSVGVAGTCTIINNV